MRPIICYVVSDEGGVGKSGFARSLACYFQNKVRIMKDGIERKKSVCLIDMDYFNQNLYRCHPEALVYDGTSAKSIEQAFEIIDKGKASDFVVVDTPAGSVSKLIQDIGGKDVFQSLNEKYDVYVFVVLRNSPAAKSVPLKAVANFKDGKNRLVVVKAGSKTNLKTFGDINETVFLKAMQEKGKVIEYEFVGEDVFRRFDAMSVPLQSFIESDAGIADRAEIEYMLCNLQSSLSKVFCFRKQK